MGEQRFRDRLQAAIGQPPELPSAATLLDRAEKQRMPRTRPFLVGALVSIVLVGALSGAITAARLSSPSGAHSQTPALHPSPSPSAATQGVALPCSLPVVVVRSGGPPAYSQVSYGSISAPGGSFNVDPEAAAQLANEPKDAIGSGPASASYSGGLWLPVQGQQVSPDGRQYAYSAYVPAGATGFNFQSSELWVYDAATRSSRLVWRSQGQVSVLAWDPFGIAVDTIPKGGGAPEDWTIDPSSGQATEGIPANTYLPDSTAGSLAGPGSSFGRDPQGDVIAVRHPSTAAGTPYSVTLFEPSGTSVNVYSGTIGDSTGFNPFSAYRQGGSFWFTDTSNTRIWLWTRARGLQRFPLSGIPALLPGVAHPTEFVAAVGTCQ